MILELLFLAGCAVLVLVAVALVASPWLPRKTRGYCCLTCNHWFPRGYDHFCIVARLGAKT